VAAFAEAAKAEFKTIFAFVAGMVSGSALFYFLN
jgi:hypothetical protein